MYQFILTGIKYSKWKSMDAKLTIYCDADFAADVDSRRSQSGIIVMINEQPVHWISKRQSMVTLATCEAELMAITDAYREAIYFRRLLEEMGAKQEDVTEIFTDSQSAIAVAENTWQSQRTKHYDVRSKFVQECIQKGIVQLKFVKTKQQKADVLTKNMGPSEHLRCVKSLGMCQAQSSSDAKVTRSDPQAEAIFDAKKGVEITSKNDIAGIDLVTSDLKLMTPESSDQISQSQDRGRN